MSNMPPNPLLLYAYSASSLCDFSSLQIKHIPQALDELLLNAHNQLNQNENYHAAELATLGLNGMIEHIIEPLERAIEYLSKVWNTIIHLNAVKNNPQIRHYFAEYQKKISVFWNEVSQQKAYFLICYEIAHHPDFKTLSLARQRSIEQSLEHFRLSGVDLEHEKRQSIAQLREQLADLEIQFADHVMDASQAYGLEVKSFDSLQGIPIAVLDHAKALADQQHKEGWFFTLDNVFAQNILHFAENRLLRARIYQDYHVRASDLGQQQQFDNTLIIKKILQHRKKEALLLGFETFAHLSTYQKMAKRPGVVSDFLTDLAYQTQPKAKQEWQELEAFAFDLGLGYLYPYDVSFVSEKLREQRFSYNEEVLRSYFPLNKVLDGLFKLLMSLFGVRLTARRESVWASGVLVYEVWCGQQQKGVLYLDLFRRAGKQDGAWMQDIQNKLSIDGQMQLPLVFLTFDFDEPRGTQLCCLSHEEIGSLLHEFGHALHHLLTDIEIPSVSGMAGFEWDAVELPSQFLEQFAWRYDVLCDMSSHIETGHVLPKFLFDKIQAARGFQRHIKVLKQISLSSVDLVIHGSGIDSADDFFLEWLQQVWLDANQVNVLPMSGLVRPLHSFSHIFSGGYAAGYYSYLWSEVLALDAYAAFPPYNGDLAATGKAFVEQILGQGSVMPAVELFRGFRGRDPDISFLLDEMNAGQAMVGHIFKGVFNEKR